MDGWLAGWLAVAAADNNQPASQLERKEGRKKRTRATGNIVYEKRRRDRQELRGKSIIYT